MENSTRISDGCRKLGAGKRLLVLALLSSALAVTPGCAGQQTWAGGATQWATSEDSTSPSPTANKPTPILILPCILFDLVFFPIALVHDALPNRTGDSR